MKQLHAPDFICKTRQRYFLQRKESVTCWQLSSDNIPGMNYHDLVATWKSCLDQLTILSILGISLVLLQESER